MLDAEEPLSHFERTLIAANLTSEEHTVVSLLVWYRLMAPQLKMLVMVSQLLFIPLIHWSSLKELFDTLRLLAGLHKDQHLQEWSQIVRKITNLTGRDLESADWEQERTRLQLGYSNRAKIMTAHEYFCLFKHHTDMLVAELESRICAKRHTTISDWWASRAVSTPSGSSSWRHIMDDAKDPKLHTTADRPNKRAVYAALPESTINWVTSQLPRIHARTSTKPEPGRKHRALYAADDTATVIAAYASWGIEEAMRHDGMLAKQAPTDVLEWLTLHEASLRSGGWWLSLDYSDFNKEHRWWEQCYLNIALARMWARSGLPAEICSDKVNATLWIAASYRYRTAQVEGKTLWALNGLFSGERNTARDNTLLHNVYKRMMISLAATISPNWKQPAWVCMCGDDEDGLHITQTDAVLYYAVGAAVGWHFNPVKQLLSQHQHEFLQIMTHGDAMPTQPYAAAVVAFVNGNWYKNAIIDIHATPESVLSIAQEIIARGGMHNAVYALARRHLNSYFKFLYKHHVRWDRLVSAPFRTRYGLQLPEYGGPLPPQAAIPDHLVHAVARQPAPAIQGLIDTNWDIVQHIPEGQRAAIIRTMKYDVYKNWYTSAINRNNPRPELSHGQVPRFNSLGFSTPNLAEVISTGLHLTLPEESITAAQAAAIAGIPLAIYTAIKPERLSVLGNTRLAGALGAIEDHEPHPTYAGLLRNKACSIAWYHQTQNH